MNDAIAEKKLKDKIKQLQAIVAKYEDGDQIFKNNRKQMEMVLSALNTGLALINPDLTIAWVNAETEKILPWEKLVGNLCYEAAGGLEQPCEGCGAILAFKDGQIHQTLRQSPVDDKWHQIVSIPVKDDKGITVQVLESVTDITQAKKGEQDLKQALDELKELKTGLEAENIYLKEEIQTVEGFKDIVGTSNPLLYVMSKVHQVAATDYTVLVQGETGVGKELIARAIHQASPRCDKPFIKLNCPSMPAHLIESELFGHEAGSFTGATQQRKGRFELAQGGTIFLDEISEIPLDLQAKLLGVLQEKQFERVGGSKTIHADVRIIAATNRNLTKAIAAGNFRADLYYRLNVFPITVPPLRNRKNDIPLLVNHFVDRFNKTTGRKIQEIPAAAMNNLQHYHWPGNIRELKNVIERACIISPGSKLIPPEKINTKSIPSPVPDPSEGVLSLKKMENRHIRRALETTGWRISGKQGAATLLDINASTLRNRMKKLGIKRA